MSYFVIIIIECIIFLHFLCSSDHVLQTPFQGWLMAIVSYQSVMLYEGVCFVGRVIQKVLIILNGD